MSGATGETITRPWDQFPRAVTFSLIVDHASFLSSAAHVAVATLTK